MKAIASQDGHDTNAEPGGNTKRRFRFARRGMEDELRQLDDIAAQVDQLTESAPSAVAPLPDARRDDDVSNAALAALDQLNERLRSASETAASGSASPSPMPGAPTQHRQQLPAPIAIPAATPVIPQPAMTWSQSETALAHQPAPEIAPVNTSTYTQNPAAANADAAQAHTPLPAAYNDAVMLPVAVDAPRMRATAPVAQAHAPMPQSALSAGYARPTDMLVDVTRILRTLEEEADLARDRIDREVANAREEADILLHTASTDAERLRDHAQQQARVLLGEVEEIISEAQHTGQQILKTADQDADSVRQQAASTLLQSQEEARRIIDHARREGEQILAEQRRLATVRAQEALREQDRLKDQIRRLEERRAQVLESLGPMIDQLSQMIPADRNVIDLHGARQ